MLLAGQCVGGLRCDGRMTQTLVAHWRETCQMLQSRINSHRPVCEETQNLNAFESETFFRDQNLLRPIPRLCLIQISGEKPVRCYEARLTPTGLLKEFPWNYFQRILRTDFQRRAYSRCRDGKGGCPGDGAPGWEQSHSWQCQAHPAPHYQSPTNVTGGLPCLCLKMLWGSCWTIIFGCLFFLYY